MTCRDHDECDFKPFFRFTFIALLTLGTMPDQSVNDFDDSNHQKDKPCL